MPDESYSHLQVKSPSTSTISYTVSSLSAPRSRLITIIRHVLRLVVVFYAILALFLKAHAEGLLGGIDLIDIQLSRLSKYSLFSNFITGIAETFTWWMLCFSSFLAMYLCLRRDYTEESLLVLQGLGIQTSTTSPYFLLAPTTTFIPTTQIQDIVIHEAFKGFGVRFYLAVIVDGATEVVVVFPNLLPRRAVLEQVWRGSRKCLYGSTG